MIDLQDPTRREFLIGTGMAAGAGLVSSLAPPALAAQSASPASGGATASLFPQFAGFGQPAEDTEAFWAKVRSHFPLDPAMTFLNNGTLGPAPDFVLYRRAMRS